MRKSLNELKAEGFRPVNVKESTLARLRIAGSLFPDVPQFMIVEKALESYYGFARVKDEIDRMESGK